MKKSARAAIKTNASGSQP